MSCGVGHRFSSALALLWLWCRLAAAAPLRPLAWEPLYAAAGVAVQGKKKKKKLSKCMKHLEPCVYTVGASAGLSWGVSALLGGESTSLSPSLPVRHTFRIQAGVCVCVCLHRSWGGRRGPSCHPSGDPPFPPPKTVSPTPTCPTQSPVAAGACLLLGRTGHVEAQAAAALLPPTLCVRSKSLNCSVPQFPLWKMGVVRGPFSWGHFEDSMS